MTYNQIDLFFRWLHVIAGITWIGHLYFFNWVNAQMQPALDDAAKKAVNPQLMPRALWWFRWGAMVTLLAGLVLFALVYMYTPGVGFGPSALFLGEGGGMSSRAVVILFGMTLGIIMWFNVWFIIWPAQKKILSGQVPAEQLPATRARAALFSKINTILSGPMLFGMLGAPHLPDAGVVTLVVFLVAGAGAIHLAYWVSARVGKTV